MKIPDDAFEAYVAMGPERSYQALAKKLGVDKRSVVRHAAKEDWAGRLMKIQEAARAATDRKLVAELQAVRETQLREVRFLRGEALKAMKSLTPEKATRIAAALSVAWKHELVLLGDTEERATSTQEIIRSEFDRWRIANGEKPVWSGDGEGS